MHFYTLHELKKMHVLAQLQLKKIEPEKTVLIEKKGLRQGSFDFLVETVDGMQIGIEVLTRPSKGKMKQKLAYAKNVDQFIFVIPEHVLDAYKKHEKTGHHISGREKFFPKEFSDKKLFAWVFDLEKHKFTHKQGFSRVFNVSAK